MGPIRLVAGSEGLVALSWNDRLADVRRHLARHLGDVDIAEVDGLPNFTAAIVAYFDGDIAALSDLAVRPPGTAFQRSVWAALRTIPAGSTWSYAALARAVGRPRAYRAVAQANGANPIPLVIPCHRVIAADGGLGGFSAGLHRKRFLLAHERCWPHQRKTG
jgi:methylated-DNA-[protein]-cysteine S-methyltransferase